MSKTFSVDSLRILPCNDDEPLLPWWDDFLALLVAVDMMVVVVVVVVVGGGVNSQCSVEYAAQDYAKQDWEIFLLATVKVVFDTITILQ